MAASSVAPVHYTYNVTQCVLHRVTYAPTCYTRVRHVIRHQRARMPPTLHATPRARARATPAHLTRI